jgi:hypothetical protein
MSKILRYAAAGMAMASLGVASTATAATSDTADVTAEILTALSVAVDPADNTLDFGQIAPGGSAATIVVAPDGTMTGGCPTAVICAGSINAPSFDVVGNPNALVYVTFTNASETLENAALDTMTVGTFTTDGSGSLTLDGAGVGEFTVGGSLTVAASQPAGVYTGTLEVNVAYN